MNRVQFWRNVSTDDNFDSKKLYKELTTDFPLVIVKIMMETLARGEGVCADVPGAHIHINWVGYDDWFAIS